MRSICLFFQRPDLPVQSSHEPVFRLFSLKHAKSRGQKVESFIKALLFLSVCLFNHRIIGEFIVTRMEMVSVPAALQTDDDN